MSETAPAAGHNRPPIYDDANFRAELTGTTIKIKTELARLEGLTLDDDFDAFVEIYKAAETWGNAVEKIRKRVKDPLLVAGKEIDAEARKTKAENSDLLAPVAAQITEFRRAKEEAARAAALEKAREEEERRRAEAAALQAAASQTATAADDETASHMETQMAAAEAQGEALQAAAAAKLAEQKAAEPVKGKGQREVIDRIEVVDLQAVPREFLTIDERKVKAAASEGVEIPGLIIHRRLTKERV